MTAAKKKTQFRPVKLSLRDLLGREYVGAVVGARSFISGEEKKALRALASEKVDFYPRALQRRLVSLLPHVGRPCVKPLKTSARGVTTTAFENATNTPAAPLSGLSYYRVAEDGRLFLVTKSEHYHAALGHGFPGYKLIENARKLGVPNASHNNTRGHITRLLEEELVRTANGVARGEEGFTPSGNSSAINRVLNLETGSIAVEAALKMVLARFYRAESDSQRPAYEGRLPVIVVIGNDDGDLQANYHGTTILTQITRGMWPGLEAALSANGVMEVRAVRPNSTADLEEVFREHDAGRRKIAGFFHEIVMMNYGARLLTKEFIRHAYALCREHDVPTVDDEIQSCVWSPELYMFREYGVAPTLVVVGKGFPGGEYAASRVLFNARMDTLPQFGALVTNGQEELASLAYLITMRWAEENAQVTRAVGEYYEEGLRALAEGHKGPISSVGGRRHMGAVRFHELEPARAFTRSLNRAGLDISVQTYKADCPPAALTKLPLTAGYEVVDAVLEKMHDALRRI